MDSSTSQAVSYLKGRHSEEHRCYLRKGSVGGYPSFIRLITRAPQHWLCNSLQGGILFNVYWTSTLVYVNIDSISHTRSYNTSQVTMCTKPNLPRAASNYHLIILVTQTLKMTFALMNTFND